MNPEEMGRRRFRFSDQRVWTPAAETRFIRKVFQAFPDAVELDEDGKPIPPEQLTFEG